MLACPPQETRESGVIDEERTTAHNEPVGVVVQVSSALGTVAALVVSADSISGERERGTLEALLVTPVSRNDIIIGKLVAATSIWIAALIVVLVLWPS